MGETDKGQIKAIKAAFGANAFKDDSRGGQRFNLNTSRKNWKAMTEIEKRGVVEAMFSAAGITFPGWADMSGVTTYPWSY